MWYYSGMQTLYRKPGKYSQIPPDHFITPAKFSALEKKLSELKKISQPNAVAEVRRLAEMGDFSENYAYQAAKGRLRGINNTILKIENQLNQAVIIAPDHDDEIIQIGHTVTLEANNQQRIYQILGSSETNPTQGIISHLSPIGEALIGHRVGEKIKIKLANKEVEYTIKKTTR